MMEVSVIIINYNTRDLLQQCIKSLYEHTSGVEFEIIVVDNASEEKAQEYICSCFPEVRWINSPTNLGFGKANNLAVQYSCGEYLFFLNSDTILQNNALLYFLDFMRSHQEEHVGTVGSWLLDDENKLNLSYGCFPTPRTEFSYLMSFLKKSQKQEQERNLKAVDFVTGADMFMRKEVFSQVSGFDPHFFMYYEETDLQKRLVARAFTNYIIPGPAIIHLEGGSFKSKGLSYSRFCMSQKSYNYYVRKHYKGIRYVGFRAAMLLIRLTLFVKRDWTFSERIKAYGLVVKNVQ